MPSDSNEGLSTALREASVHHESSKEIEDPDGDDFHGDCKDSSSSGFYDDHLEAYTSCHEMRHQCSHPTLGKSIRQMCPRSCHECVPQMWPVTSMQSPNSRKVHQANVSKILSRVCSPDVAGDINAVTQLSESPSGKCVQDPVTSVFPRCGR